MRKYLLTLLLLSSYSVAAQEESSNEGSGESNTYNWKLYTDVDLFAFSEVVSIKEFVDSFDETLKPGNTAFSQNKIEIGFEWKSWRFAYIERFDYITEFSEDTAFIHHAENNNITVPTDRDYDVFLGIERVRAKGFKAGYTWQVRDGLSFDFGANYYYDLSELQSGKVEANGKLDPLSDDLLNQANAIIDTLSQTNRDLTPLRDIAAQISFTALIDYAYNSPKFGEKTYRKPNITGSPNPVLTGVSFEEPNGWGYSFDFGVAWQATDKLHLDLRLIDIGNKFKWENAPQTFATFDLNAAVLDLLDVAQDFVNGEIVDPNGIIDRQVNVDIFNGDYNQTLPWRADLNARYSLDKELKLFGWTPNISILGNYYYTDTKDFPRFGVGFDNNVEVLWDFGGDALILAYEGKYGFARLIADDLNTDKAHTFGVSVGVNYAF